MKRSRDTPGSPLLSVVIPIYNEEESLGPLVERLRPILEGIPGEYEVVAVDDGSTDATNALLQSHQGTWPSLRVVRLRANAGHQAALSAGLARARGAYVVSIDADLQDPPEKIAEMLELARSQRLDVVYGVRVDRSSDTVFKRTTASLYYRLMRRMVGFGLPHHGGDFRLLSRAVVETLRQLPERRPVYRLLIPSLGFASGEVRYSRQKRVAGTTKYPLVKMVKLAADSVTDFTTAPLRVATWLGLASFVGCLLLAAFGMWAYLSDRSVPGWTSMFVAVSMLGGVQLVCVGLLGEYVGRIYTAVQNRPQYLVARDSTDERVPGIVSPRVSS